VHREVTSARPGTPSPKVKWSQYAITFNASDHPASTRDVGTLPMVCTPTINNIAVVKTLIDGGAGLNVISTETFAKLQVSYNRLMPTMLFSGVTDETMIPIGQVRLTITFGSRNNYRTVLIDFYIAHIGLPYNVIRGYPMLAKFMAATHHAYDVVKMPGVMERSSLSAAMKKRLYAPSSMPTRPHQPPTQRMWTPLTTSGKHQGRSR